MLRGETEDALVLLPTIRPARAREPFGKTTQTTCTMHNGCQQDKELGRASRMP
jgi:hypothetical protein